MFITCSQQSKKDNFQLYYDLVLTLCIKQRPWFGGFYILLFWLETVGVGGGVTGGFLAYILSCITAPHRNNTYVVIINEVLSESN